jgi:CheY-like chemotaxis protein
MTDKADLLIGKKILIVEDEQDLLDIFEECLLNLGAIVTKANNGEVAFDCLENLKFDLIISDIEMPKLDGIGLLKKINSTFRTPPIFLFLSGNQDFNLKELLSLGAKDLIPKPFEINKLIDTILKHT